MTNGQTYHSMPLLSLNTLLHNASTLPTHYETKNQNVPIVTLVQHALYQRQRILHQCSNWYILIFCYKMRWQCQRILHQKKLMQNQRILHQKKLMQNALIWYIHQNVPIVTLVQNALSLYNAKCNNVIKSEN